MKSNYCKYIYKLHTLQVGIALSDHFLFAGIMEMGGGGAMGATGALAPTLFLKWAFGPPFKAFIFLNIMGRSDD